MAISVVSSVDNTANSAAPTVTIPATTVEADDLVVVFLGVVVGAEPTAEPAGFTAVCDGLPITTQSDTYTKAYYKVAVGGEENDAVDWTLASATRWVTAAVVLRGVDATVFDVTPVHSTHHLNTLNDPTPQCAAITTQTDGAMVLAMSLIHASGNTMTAAASDSGDGEWMNVVELTDADVGALGTHEIIATAGAVGGDIHTYTDADAGAENQTLIFALKPAAAGPSAALTGTATPSATEAEIVAGGETVIITLTDDTWVASGATFDAQRQNIIDGLDSAQSELTGWNAEVRDKEAVTAVVRTSDTVVTITLTASASYAITAQETITVTIPGTALTGASPITADETFTVNPDASGGVNRAGINRGLINGGLINNGLIR